MNCKGCAYDTRKDGCEAFLDRPKDCWNYTTEKEAAEREKTINQYIQQYKSDPKCSKVTLNDPK